MLPMVAGGIVCLMLSAALAVDVGYWRYQQRLAQNAADAAAIAGGISLNYDNKADWTKARTAARTASSTNGFTNDVATVSVLADVPNPNTPSRPGGSATPYPSNQAIEVDVRKNEAEFFSAVLPGLQLGKIGARAVAASLPDESACMFQLDYRGGVNATGVDITGHKDLNLVNCGLIANGPVNVPGYSPSVTGVDYWPPSQCTANNGTCTNNTGYASAHAMAAPANDPCARVTGCAFLSGTWFPPDSGSALNGQQTFNCGSGYTMCPQAGDYLTDSNGDQIGYAVIHSGTCCANATNFAPGVYFIYGGATINKGMSGSGVTLVNVDGAITYDGTGAGTPTLTAPAPPSPTQGVVFYQPPSNSNTLTLNGGGNGGGCNATTPDSCWEGLFYAPSADLTSDGGANDFAVLVIGDMRGNGAGSGSGYCTAQAPLKCAITVDPALGHLTPIQYALPTHVVLTE